ncbi:Phosphoglucose isomerase (PGI), partial [Dillenia turbinata]
GFVCFNLRNRGLKDLKAHVEEIKKTHLRDLISDPDRCRSMMVDIDRMLLDYSRQCATLETFEKLFKLAEGGASQRKINSIFSGGRINKTESRAILHVALRAPRDAIIQCDGKNVVPDVWNVLDMIHDFYEKVCSGSWVGATGKTLTDVASIGMVAVIFVHSLCILLSRQVWIMCQCVILAIVDPSDGARNITGLNPETVNFVVVSKTFTTAETMLNARTMNIWISASLGPEAVAKQWWLSLVEKFRIDPNNAFASWDWVGGQYSVWFEYCRYLSSMVSQFLKRASRIDQHFYTAPFEKNIPERMESIGKGVSIDGVPLHFETGEIDFGEPGTNGQHSFYQLIHQSDALAYGKTPEQLQKENVSPHLIPHKLLAIYEQRIGVEGFIWGINSFDQWGVELGKSLATQVKKQPCASRTKGEPIPAFPFSTLTLLKRYL